MVNTSSPQPAQPRAGFVPVASSCPYVTRSGTFFIRPDAGAGTTLGTQLGENQADSAGVVDRGFLLAFADFALTEVTEAITLKLSADYMGSARAGDWIEATVFVRSRSSELVFADVVIASEGGDELIRAHGTFRPYKKRD
jgi:acyl-coenzyme A thioesterase PaaI-like protein